MNNLTQHFEALKAAILKESNGNPFIDAQLIKQFFKVSDRTLARRREDGSLEAFAFGKKKLFYHVDNVIKLFVPVFLVKRR